MKCSYGISGAGMSDLEKEHAHPYLESFKIVCGKDVDDENYNSLHLINKFNEISNGVLIDGVTSVIYGIKSMFSKDE